MIGIPRRKELVMRPLRRPALAVLASSLLIFFVLVGSAFALGAHHAAAKPSYHQRCANGAVKAIAVVVADPNKGFQKAYTTDPSFFKTKWSCVAKAVFEARRVDRGVYDIRVTGLGGATPIVAAIGNPVRIAVSPTSDGGFEIRLAETFSSGLDNYVDQSFVLMLM